MNKLMKSEWMLCFTQWNRAKIWHSCTCCILALIFSSEINRDAIYFTGLATTIIYFWWNSWCLLILTWMKSTIKAKAGCKKLSKIKAINVLPLYLIKLILRQTLWESSRLRVKVSKKCCQISSFRTNYKK